MLTITNNEVFSFQQIARDGNVCIAYCGYISAAAEHGSQLFCCKRSGGFQSGNSKTNTAITTEFFSVEFVFIKILAVKVSLFGGIAFFPRQISCLLLCLSVLLIIVYNFMRTRVLRTVFT